MFKKNNLETLLGIGSFRSTLGTDKTKDTDETQATAVKIIDHEIDQTVDRGSLSEQNESEVEPLIENLSDESSTIKPDPVTEPAADSNFISLDIIRLLEKQIHSLENQLESKDAQLASKDEIIKNFQVLLKREQDAVLQLSLEKTRKKPWYEQFWKRKEESSI